MSKLLKIAIAGLLALALPIVATAAELSQAPLEAQPPAEYECASFVLLEPESGQIIAEKNADARREVASVTKIMSILLTIEAIEDGKIALNDPVVVSKNAAGMGGSQALLDIGETQTVGTLIKCTIVASANDATVALAEHIAGSVGIFVDRMNERATELGMDNTHFVNATGLPAEGQYTTARDVARMSMALIKHDLYFDYSNIWLDDLDHGDGRVTSLTNTNRLIRLYDGCDGIKTGSADAAGYCLSASAVRGGMRLIAVVLGAGSGSERFSIAGQLMDYGFANYRRYPVAERGARVRGELRVVGGGAQSVPLMLDGDLTLLMRKGEEGNIELRADLPESVRAPVRQGDLVGSVDVIRDGQVLTRIPVAAAQSVGRQGYLGALYRLMDIWF